MSLVMAFLNFGLNPLFAESLKHFKKLQYFEGNIFLQHQV